MIPTLVVRRVTTDGKVTTLRYDLFVKIFFPKVTVLTFMLFPCVSSLFFVFFVLLFIYFTFGYLCCGCDL